MGKKIFVVIHKDDANNEIKAIGAFEWRDDAVACLCESFNKELSIIRSTFTINEHKMRHDNSFASIEYGDDYEDVFEIQEVEYHIDKGL